MIWLPEARPFVPDVVWRPDPWLEPDVVVRAPWPVAEAPDPWTTPVAACAAAGWPFAVVP
ncbi:MAG TPA: hypothetical protein VIS06_18795 [Mycobacteriales bacterium]